MRSPQITISAVIPTYNRASLLGRAIDSVLAQTRPVQEIIVVDDGGTDDTAEVVARYGKAVKYVRRVNGGLAAARNTGVQNSRCDWVAFLDDDDEWLPHRIESQVAVLTKNPSAILCYGGLLNRRPEGKETYLPAVPPHRLLRTFRLKNPFTPISVLVRRDTFQKVGGFNEALRCVEDWEFHARILQGNTLVSVDAPIVRVYESGGTMSTNVEDMLRSEISILGVLLAGLSGPSRWIWRRRIMGRNYFRAAVTARNSAQPCLQWVLRSLLSWPFPSRAAPRYKTLFLELVYPRRTRQPARSVSVNLTERV